jgi:hypothetical protein
LFHIAAIEPESPAESSVLVNRHQIFTNGFGVGN